MVQYKVIVTDRDTTDMYDVSKIFPSSTSLVCEFHILKNVRSICILHWKVKNSKRKYV